MTQNSAYTLDVNSAICQADGVVEFEHEGHSGLGYWNTNNQLNSGLMYSLKSQKNQTVTLNIRYANGSNQARPAQIVIDGKAVDLLFNTTNAWNNWHTQTAQINLKEGIQSFNLLAINSAGLPNIDVIQLQGDLIQPGECGNAITSGFYPTNNSRNIPPDTFLSIQFDAAPNFSGLGVIEIIQTSDNTIVDRINLAGDQDFIGFNTQAQRRAVNTRPATLMGTEFRIYPHNNVLKPNTEYSVKIPAGIVSGEIQGACLDSINDGRWVFSTREALPARKVVSVDDNGQSDFNTVQGALNFLMQHQLNGGQINIAEGQYYEMLFLRGLSNVTLNGAGAANTRIFYNNADAINPGSGGSSTSPTDLRGGRSLFLVEGTDLLKLKNLSLHNTHLRSENAGAGAQAETLYFNSSSGRLVAKNSNFLSEQDTLLLKGYSWFFHSIIAGNVDFIWGYPQVALFEESEIRSLGDSKNPSGDGGGYVLQARVENSDSPGFVFLNSQFTKSEGPAGNTIGNGKTYLARSGNSANSASRYDNISFINCQFGEHINESGWLDESERGKYPNPIVGSASRGLKEYGSQNLSGEAINPNRNSAYYLLSADEAKDTYADRFSIFRKANIAVDWMN